MRTIEQSLRLLYCDRLMSCTIGKIMLGHEQIETKELSLRIALRRDISHFLPIIIVLEQGKFRGIERGLQYFDAPAISFLCHQRNRRDVGIKPTIECEVRFMKLHRFFRSVKNAGIIERLPDHREALNRPRLHQPIAIERDGGPIRICARGVESAIDGIHSS